MASAARDQQRDQQWMLAAKRHRLSAEQVRMARALGLNPTKLGRLDNHRQEPWKAPLPQFIEDLYAKRFGRTRPGSGARNGPVGEGDSE